MKHFRFNQLHSSFVIAMFLLIPLATYPIVREEVYISQIELHEISDNPKARYVYLGKEYSQLYDVVCRISDLESNNESPLYELKTHVEDGFSIGLHSAVVEALDYAQRVLENSAEKIDSAQVQEIAQELDAVIDQVVNNTLTITTKKPFDLDLGSDTDTDEGLNRCGFSSKGCSDAPCCTPNPCKVVKVRANLDVFGKARFRKCVEIDGKLKIYGKSTFKNDATFKDNVHIEGDLTVDGAVNFTLPLTGLTITDVVIENLSATDIVVENLSATDVVVENLSVVDGFIENLSTTDAVIENLSTTDATIQNLSVTDLVVLSCIDNLCVTNLSVSDITLLSCIDNLCVVNLSVTDLSVASCVDSLCVTNLSVLDETVTGSLSVNDAFIQDLSVVNGTIDNLTVTNCVTSLCVNELSAVDVSISGMLSANDAFINNLSVNDIVIVGCVGQACIIDLSVVDASVSGTLSVADEFAQNLSVVNATIDNLTVTNCVADLCVLDLSVVDGSISGTLSVADEFAQNLSVVNATIDNLTVTSCVDNLCVTNLSTTDIFAGSLSLCDLIVSCDIFMENSTSPSIGNILKNGNRFIHNFGTDNTFVGVNAGNFTNAGAENVGIGRNALFSNTTGFNDTAVGAFSLNTNTIGVNNAAVGTYSLVNNIQGNDNVAVGSYSLVSNTTGSGNTAVGFQTGYSLATGNNNVFIGNNTASNVTNAFTNLILGYNSGLSLTSGNDNIYLSNAGVATESGAIRIGTPATHTSTFVQGIFGTTVAGTGIGVFVDANGQLGTVVSSARFKHDIEGMNDVSSRIYDLRPVSFVYNNDETDTPQYGLIAEEVDQVFPALVVNDEEGKPYTVRYHLLPVMLLNEIQKLRSAVNDQGDAIVSLKEDNLQINAAMNAIMKRLTISAE